MFFSLTKFWSFCKLLISLRFPFLSFLVLGFRSSSTSTYLTLSFILYIISWDDSSDFIYSFAVTENPIFYCHLYACPHAWPLFYSILWFYATWHKVWPTKFGMVGPETFLFWKIWATQCLTNYYILEVATRIPPMKCCNQPQCSGGKKMLEKTQIILTGYLYNKKKQSIL